MTTSQQHSIPSGEHTHAGFYQCTSCGYVIHLQSDDEIPNCPNDEGLHANHAWQPITNYSEADPTLPNSPQKT
ncbi:MAG: hypothetical protein KDA52_00825 [Planctomycetaceae bacterium]|nr:hypothetical protein [Planctomycetaceae bacterium]